MRHSARYALPLILIFAAGLTACDSASSDDDPAGDPTPIAPLVKYEVNGFGDFPADHADLIWYTDAVGDTVKVGFRETRWSESFRLDTLNHNGTNLYLYTVVRGQATEVGIRAAIYVDGELVNEQYRDGFDGAQQGTNTLYAIAGAPGN